MGDAGEDALALGEGGYGRDSRDADELLHSLVGAEEEEVVGDDGAADGSTVEVRAIFGLCGRRLWRSSFAR